MILRDVLKRTGLSFYTANMLAKRHGLGSKEGRYRVFSEKDVLVLQMLAHYQKHKNHIVKLYRLIKKYPGIDDLVLRKKANLNNYQYNIALTELSFVCYLWEDSVLTDTGKEKPVYYVVGDFFEEYLKKYCEEGLQGVVF